MEGLFSSHVLGSANHQLIYWVTWKLYEVSCNEQVILKVEDYLNPGEGNCAESELE